MDCPHCQASNTLKHGITELGYPRYRCRACQCQFNERTGTPYNHIHYPTDIVMLSVFYYYRFKNSLVDVTEHMALRGFKISHETVRLWTQIFGTQLGLKFRQRRYGKTRSKWHIDATYLKIQGHWYYLYRAIDKQGNLIDVYLSDTRDKQAAKNFFKSCIQCVKKPPKQITTDKEPALYGAIENTLGDKVKHRDSKYKNNLIEQNHRMIKSRTAAMKGFQSPWCAMVFCTVFEEIAQFFRMKNKSLAQRRSLFASRFQEFMLMA